MTTATVCDPEVLGWPSDGPTLRLDYRRFRYAGKFVMSNTGKAVIRAVEGTGNVDGRAADQEGRPGRTADRAAGGDGNADDGADAGNTGEVADDGSAGAPADRWPTEEVDDEDGWNDRVLAAAAFNEDRTDGDVLWIRYVTVRDDRRGEGLGPELCAFVADRAADRGYERVRIAVNNPFAFEALYRAGFAYTGTETGLAELVLERPADETATPPAEDPTSRYHEGLEIYLRRDLSPEETAFLERKLGGSPPDPLH